MVYRHSSVTSVLMLASFLLLLPQLSLGAPLSSGAVRRRREAPMAMLPPDATLDLRAASSTVGAPEAAAAVRLRAERASGLMRLRRALDEESDGGSESDLGARGSESDVDAGDASESDGESGGEREEPVRRRRKARGGLRPRTAAAPAPADDVGVTVTERDSPEMAQKKAEIKRGLAEQAIQAEFDRVKRAREAKRTYSECLDNCKDARDELQSGIKTARTCCNVWYKYLGFCYLVRKGSV